MCNRDFFLFFIVIEETCSLVVSQPKKDKIKSRSSGSFLMTFVLDGLAPQFKWQTAEAEAASPLV